VTAEKSAVGLCSGDNMFPVRYELNFYINLLRNSVFKCKYYQKYVYVHFTLFSGRKPFCPDHEAYGFKFETKEVEDIIER
jgi:hypothetical protein